MRPKRCRCCGKVFTVSPPRFAVLYCSDGCRNKAKKIRRHEYHQSSYKPRQPHEIKCKQCGKTFLGRGRSLYCITCLTDGSPYMTKLLMNRENDGGCYENDC